MNNEYLGHSFEEIENVDVCYICKTCRVKVWNAQMSEDNDYWLLSDDLYHIGKKLTLNCTEYIIKNIIE